MYSKVELITNINGEEQYAFNVESVGDDDIDGCRLKSIYMFSNGKSKTGGYSTFCLNSNIDKTKEKLLSKVQREIIDELREKRNALKMLNSIS